MKFSSTYELRPAVVILSSMNEFELLDSTITVGASPSDEEMGFQPVPSSEESKLPTAAEHPAANSFFRMPSISIASTSDGGHEIAIDFVARNLKEEEELLALKDDKEDGTTEFEKFVPVKDWKSGRWINCGNSLYGLFIRFVLCHPNSAFIIVLFPAVFLLGGAQGVILINLWRSLEHLDEAPSQFCTPQNNRLFLTAIMAVFLVSLVPALNDIINEFKIVSSARLVFQVSSPMAGDGQATIARVHRNAINVICCMMVVIYESCIWIAVLLIGIMYILTSPGVGNIVQAAVAISFINEIDNMIMWVGFNEYNLQSVRFRTHPIDENPGKRFFFTIVFAMPVFLCVSVGIVYGLHASYC